MDVAPGTRLGHYILEEELAVGGHGRVFRARQSGPGGFSKAVAIKIVNAAAAGNPAAVEAFLREGRTAALLNHRNIVAVHEVGESRGLYFLVMELVDGVDLLQLGNAVGPQLPLWIKVAIALELFRALAHAHGLRHERAPSGVVHRDVKPANVLLSRDGDVKLTDFGLAKALQVAADEITASGAVKGTPGYMSPEQHAGQEAIAAADVYSAGMVLYRLCVGGTPRGALPFSAAAVQQSELPAGLGALITAALQPLPAQRPSALEVIDGLVRLLEQIAPRRSLAQLGAELAVWVGRARAAGVPRAAGARIDPWGETIGVTAPPDGGGFAPDVVTGEATRARRSGRRSLRLAVVGACALALAAAGFSVALRCGADPPFRPPFLERAAGSDAMILAGAMRADAGAPLSVAEDAEVATAAPAARPDAALERPAYSARSAPAKGGRRPRRPAPWPRRPPRAAGSPAATGTGALSVDSNPWSWVHVDGKRVGMTPLWRLALRAGAHTVRLVAADGSATTRRVTLKPDAHVNLGMVDLRGGR